MKKWGAGKVPDVSVSFEKMKFTLIFRTNTVAKEKNNRMASE